MSCVPAKFVPVRLWERIYAHRIDDGLLRFARSHLSLWPLYKSSGEARRATERYSAFVVGSDQVWRPANVDVASFMLDFVPERFEGPRIAYAASFGTDDPGFTPELIKRTTPLAKRFTALSVRESSGVELSRELWDVEAVQMPDPTLLVGAHQYLHLAATAANGSAEHSIVAYILDSSAEIARALDRISTDLATPVRHIHQPVPPEGGRDLILDDFVRPTIPEWLNLLSTAKFVVTDSFHGIVFSVIFQRPFLAIANHARGLTRMQSFLRSVGLEDRLTEGRSPDLTTTLLRPIDWEPVSAAIDTARVRGTQWLDASLRWGKTESPGDESGIEAA